MPTVSSERRVKDVASDRLDSNLRRLSMQHRRTDVLPIHPDLVNMLPEWINGIGPDQVPLPRLACPASNMAGGQEGPRTDGHPRRGSRRGDRLPRGPGGTPASRNCSGTGPLWCKLGNWRSTLASKMTMKDTHIGIDDQDKALAALPNPCQHFVSISGGFQRHSAAEPKIARPSEDVGSHDATSCKTSPCDNLKQEESPDDTSGDSWRRRELNPRPVMLRSRPLRA